MYSVHRRGRAMIAQRRGAAEQGRVAKAKSHLAVKFKIVYGVYQVMTCDDDGATCVPLSAAVHRCPPLSSAVHR